VAGRAGGDPGAGRGLARVAPGPLGGVMQRAGEGERGVYVISVAAELAGMHPQTLRIYERRGLLDPARTGGGSRRYSQRDIDRLRRISELTEAGLNLAGVKAVMELEDEVARLRRQLADVVAEARDAIERTHRQY